MPAWKLEFRLRHDCPLSLLSREFPEVPISMWRNGRTEYIEIGTSEGRTLAAIEARLRATVGSRRSRFRPSVSLGGTASLVLQNPIGPESVFLRRLDASLVLPCFPVQFLDGWEQFRAIALDPARLPRLLAQLREQGPVQILGKRISASRSAVSSIPMSWEEVSSGLTSRQKQALLTAIQRGYFEVPRRVEISEMATALAVSRTTFGEHVQKAEGKLMRALVPFLSFEVQRQPDADTG